MSIKKSKTMKFVNKIAGGSITLNKLLWAIRMGEELSQPEFAAILGISKSHLNDIEKGRKTVSPERAARFAKELGYSQDRFVELSLQAIVDNVGLKFKVVVRAA